jgi:hypothetical protein
MKLVVVRQPAIRAAAGEGAPLKENEFRISDVPPGSVLLMGDAAVFNVREGSIAISFVHRVLAEERDVSQTAVRREEA